MTRRQAVGWLVVVCLVWGVSFTVVKAALDSVSPLVTPRPRTRCVCSPT